MSNSLRGFHTGNEGRPIWIVGMLIKRRHARKREGATLKGTMPASGRAL